jgi:uncharacterized protein YlzI (FlbEa/FlbD family)
MSKFIKLTLLDGKRVILQVDDIERVVEIDGRSRVFIYGADRDYIEVEEIIDKIYRLLETKQ